MNRKQAEERGYQYTGVYSQDKEDVKQEIANEKRKGNKAVLVNVPTSKYSRGYHGMGYLMCIIKSPENIKEENIKSRRRVISQLEYEINKRKEELEKFETELVAELTNLNALL